MNKILAVLFSVVATAVFAGMNNVVIAFSTPGPDKYADGTAVLDGECYALVYTPAGSTFQGFNADGTAVGDSKVAVKAPLAKGGKCPPVLFQVDESYATAKFGANYASGTWAVYLLDTRVLAVDAEGVVQKDGDGNDIVASVGGKSIKGYGEVAKSDGTSLASVQATGSVQAGSASVTEIKIKGIQLIDGNVHITVQGANAGKFELSAGAAATELTAEGKERAGTTDELTIVRPQQAGGEFFKINRK